MNLAFSVPIGNRYLWDFATLPSWRGCGIYPALLRAILEDERPQAARFWIGHADSNHASGRGIAKAGFQRLGSLAASSSGRVFLSVTASERRWRQPPSVPPRPNAAWPAQCRTQRGGRRPDRHSA